VIILAVNWNEVTAIATSVLAVGLLGGFGAAAVAAEQVREARRTREAQVAVEFFRRWNDEALEKARRLFARYQSADELRDAYAGYVAANAREAYVLTREPDFFEQLAALESAGAFDFELIVRMIGPTLITRWDMWRPAIEHAHGPGSYPMFENLVRKLKRESGSSLNATVNATPPGPVPRSFEQRRESEPE
jgi:hypothetical protein